MSQTSGSGRMCSIALASGRRFDFTQNQKKRLPTRGATGYVSDSSVLSLIKKALTSIGVQGKLLDSDAVVKNSNFCCWIEEFSLSPANSRPHLPSVRTAACSPAHNGGTFHCSQRNMNINGQYPDYC